MAVEARVLIAAARASKFTLNHQYQMGSSIRQLKAIGPAIADNNLQLPYNIHINICTTRYMFSIEFLTSIQFYLKLASTATIYICLYIIFMCINMLISIDLTICSVFHCSHVRMCACVYCKWILHIVCSKLTANKSHFTWYWWSPIFAFGKLHFEFLLYWSISSTIIVLLYFNK